jgi:ketosteroid isomerase-like protein
MGYQTPAELFDAVVDSRNRGDLATYVACYEPTATIIPQPGMVAHGHEAISAFLSFFTSLRPAFTVVKREFIEGFAVALHLSSWTLSGTDKDGSPVLWRGRTCDVLRKQTDGTWLVAIDNPWGTALLD